MRSHFEVFADLGEAWGAAVGVAASASCPQGAFPAPGLPLLHPGDVLGIIGSLQPLHS